MLEVGKVIFYLAPDAMIHQCEVTIVTEKNAWIKCLRGSFESEVSLYSSRIFDTYEEAEQFLYI